MAEIEKYAKESRPVTRKRRWPSRFLIIGLVLLLIVLMYRLLIYASYLEVGEARFSDKGGSTTIHVETDAVFVSLHVQNGEWFAITQSGKNIIVNVKENKGAKDRRTSFTVMTGAIDGWSKAKKEVAIVQSGKGATYLNAEPQSIELTEMGYNGASTKTVIVDTDGDKWEIVTCPDWVWYRTEDNKLELAAITASEQNREGVLLLKSHNEYTEVRVSQKMKPKLTPPTPKPTPKPVPPELPKPVPTPSYNVQYHSIPTATSFSRIMVVDQEITANEADKLLKHYSGWRFETMDELRFLFQYYESTLPKIGEGYWYYDSPIQGGGYTLGSSAYNLPGEYDSNQYKNRVILVK